MTAADKKRHGFSPSPLLWTLLGLCLFGSLALLTTLEVLQLTDSPWQAAKELLITDFNHHRCPTYPDWVETEVRAGVSKQKIEYAGKGQQVVELPSSNPDFLIFLEYNTRVCNAFKLTIRRGNDSACESVETERNHTSLDVALNRWIQTERGPDSFMVKTEGSEAYTTEWHHYRGKCTYEYNVELQNAGVFWLQVWWMYQNYDAYNELNFEVPEVKLQQLLPEPLRLDICEKSCRPLHVGRLDPEGELRIATTKSKSKAIKGFLSAFFSSIDPGNPVVPYCEGKIPTRGIYAPAHFLDTLDSSDLKNTTSKYRFVPGGCEWHHAGRRFVNHEACTSRPNEMLMVGDDHVKGLFEGMVHRLGGTVQSYAEPERKTDRYSVIGHLNVTYQWDDYGTDTVNRSCEHYEKFDVIVLGIGSTHAIQGKTTEEYGKTIPFLLTRFPHCEERYVKPQDIIFIQAPASIPFTSSTTSASEIKDLSTNTKLQHWRDITYPLALETGWYYIDYFELTMPFVLEQLRKGKKDFVGTEANEVAIDEIIGKSGICDTPADRAKKGRI